MIDFGAALDKIRAELAPRPPFLLAVFDRFVDVLSRRPLRFVELHGSQILAPRERRRVEPRLPMRREAIALVMGALLIETDLCSLRSGRLRSDGIFSGSGQIRIAELTGLSLGRIRRCICDLVAAEYLTATQPIERYVTLTDEVGHCAHNSIYRLTEKFFERVSYDRRLRRERAKASERRKARGRIYGASLLRARVSIRNRRRLILQKAPAAAADPRAAAAIAELDRRSRQRPPDPSR